jgi:hypothetical protein
VSVPAFPAILNHGLRLAAGWMVVGSVWAQATPPADSPASTLSGAPLNTPVSMAVSAPVNAPASAGVAPAVVRPLPNIKVQWKDLTRSQQLALEPLAPHWVSLSEGQRNKWLTLSKNFANLPDYEKSTMHSRMAEWATLTPQQRSQARLNFGETNRIPQVEKKAQWQAYQSLPEEEKRKWTANQQSPVLGAALAPKPAAPDKLSHVQTPAGQLPAKGKTPGVKDVDPKTLLPALKVTPTKADATPA